MANFIRWNPTTHIYELSTNDGVSFAPLPLNASILNEGTINTARLPSIPSGNLPANVAYKDINNLFTTNQTVTGNIDSTSPTTGIGNVFNGNDPLYLKGATYTRLHLVDTAAAAGSRNWQILNYLTDLIFATASDDAGQTWSPNFKLSRNGNALAVGALSEYNRGTPLGHWIAFTPSLAATGGAMTLNANYCSSYMVVGKTLTLSLYWTVTLSAASVIFLTMPGGFVSSNYTGMPCCLATGNAMIQVEPGGTIVKFYANGAGASIPAGTYASIVAVFSFQIN